MLLSRLNYQLNVDCVTKLKDIFTCSLKKEFFYFLYTYKMLVRNVKFCVIEDLTVNFVEVS